MTTASQNSPAKLPLPVICADYDATCREMSLRAASACHRGDWDAGHPGIAAFDLPPPAIGVCPILAEAAN